MSLLFICINPVLYLCTGVERFVQNFLDGGSGGGGGIVFPSAVFSTLFDSLRLPHSRAVSVQLQPDQDRVKVVNLTVARPGSAIPKGDVCEW